MAFDATGRAYYATLGFRFVGPVNATNPDIVMATSVDGGRTWSSKTIAMGSGVETGVGDLLDKEYVAAWGDGNAIVTYGDFRLGQKGAFISGQIHALVTHNGGATWSASHIISGDLDEAFVSVPTVTADGRLFVAFLNTTDLTTGRDDYEVVQVDPATGARIAGPFKVATVIDGATDYPFALGRQTYHDSAFRSWAAGNITADPTDPNHLAVVWSDMRNSTLPAPANSYQATTNSDVIVSQSADSGRHWSAPASVHLSGDQWMPWGAYGNDGTLHIGTFDRHRDPANHRYDFTLLSETSPGSLTFTSQVVSTAMSDPTQGSAWFARTLDPAFPNANAFIGDYGNIAAMPDGSGVVAYWTDLRNQACFAGACGHGEDAYFAKVG